MGIIRVLHVLDQISIKSGVSSVVLNYFYNINKNKVQFDFIVHKEVEYKLQEKINNFGGQIYYLPDYSLKAFIKYEKKIYDILNATNYQIVHCHVPHEAFFCLRFAKKFGIKTRIIHSHNTKGSDIYLKNLRNKLLNYIGIRYSNQVFACSLAASDFLNKGNTNGNTYIMHNSIDTKKYKYNDEKRELLLKEFNIDGNQFIIGHIGRFEKQKNHKFIIDVFKQIKKCKSDSTLMLIGVGKEEDYVKNYALELGVNQDIIYVKQTERVSDYMLLMNLFILPSLYEGLPVVAIEAQASGLPCILSDTITREVKISDEVTFLSLESTEAWVKEIQKYYDYTRKSEDISFYDIRKSSIDLSIEYERLVQRNGY